MARLPKLLLSLSLMTGTLACDPGFTLTESGTPPPRNAPPSSNKGVTKMVPQTHGGPTPSQVDGAGAG